MSSFQVGQRVVCVDDQIRTGQRETLLTQIVTPVKGHIYTIRAIQLGEVRNCVCIKLVEIDDQLVDVLIDGILYTGEIVWEAHCFRPLVERKTDISVFRAMLTPKKESVPA